MLVSDFSLPTLLHTHGIVFFISVALLGGGGVYISMHAYIENSTALCLSTSGDSRYGASCMWWTLLWRVDAVGRLGGKRRGEDGRPRGTVREGITAEKW